MASLERVITKEHDNGEKRSLAIYSACLNYRYRLRREWNPDQSVLGYIMLNPSTADEMKNDPTIERCERRAQMLGFGGIEILNLFAYRSTSPKKLYEVDDPVGERNDQIILEMRDSLKRIFLAWGAHGQLHQRSNQVKNLLAGGEYWHFGLTKAGEPRHPLYISYEKPPSILIL